MNVQLMVKLFLEKAKEWAFYAFLFTVPIFCVAGNLDTRVVQERYFQAACMILGSLYFGNIWIMLFLWLGIILFIVNGSTVGASNILSIFLTGIIFACSRNFFSNKSFVKYSNALYLVLFLSLILTIFQLFGISPINTTMSSDGVLHPEMTFTLPCGLFFLPAFHGIFITLICSILVMSSSWLFFLLLIPVFICQSSAVAMALGFLVIFYAYHKLRRFFWLFVIAGIIGAGTYLYMDNKHDKLTFNSRFENWHCFLSKALANPLGYGPDSFRNYNTTKNFQFTSDEDYNPIIRTKLNNKEDILVYHSADLGKTSQRYKGRIPKHITDWDNPHNEYIQLFFEYGIFGIILLICLLREIYYRFILSDKSKEVLALFACLCCFFIVSITQFPFHLARLSGIFGVILGAYYANTDKYYKLMEDSNG